MTEDEFAFLVGSYSNTKKPAVPAFLSPEQAEEASLLCCLPSFSKLSREMEDYSEAFKEYLDKPSFEFPTEYLRNLPDIQKLLFVKVFYLSGMLDYVKILINQHLPSKFNETSIYGVTELFEDSKINVPLFLILTKGVDPSKEVHKLAEDNLRRLHVVSLGQGQTEKALNSIEAAQKQGYWVYLQNCHLVPSFMKPLEQVIIKLQNEYMEYNPDFRLWISGLSSPEILPSILMNSAKVTVESPSGLKPNLLAIASKYRKLYKLELEMMQKKNKHYEFNKLLLSLMHFHSILIERSNYGAIGWNIAYAFNEADFNISKEILKTSLLKNKEVPYKALLYLTADCIYGGRVTEDWDKVTMMALLKDLFNAENIDSTDHAVNNSLFRVSFTENYDDFVQYIVDTPETSETAAIGLHQNAFVVKQAKESAKMLEVFNQISKLDQHIDVLPALTETESKIKEMLPREVNIEEVKAKYPIDYNNCFNSILVQEIMRYNKLLSLVYNSVEDCVSAFKGLIPLTEQVELIAGEIADFKIPAKWVSSSYPSVKPLAAWIEDLKQRIDFFLNWIEKGTPKQFWFSAFYFSQAFLTGIKQNYARAKQLSIDSLDFKIEFVKGERESEGDSYFVTGLFIEGAMWDENAARIDEIAGKGLMSPMPGFLIQAVLKETPIEHNSVYLFFFK